jgi:7-carboxy-7-deazaguanine synthase
MHSEKSLALVREISQLPEVWDVHVETNGSISLDPFISLRKQDEKIGKTLRFIVDYKLPSSGEEDKMDCTNFPLLKEQDEVKFVVANDADFYRALEVVKTYSITASVLFSPVWDTMPPHHLVELLLAYRPHGGRARLNLQLHKIIWDPDMRGV